MPRLFGTDGVRGVANREPLTPETLARLGRALGESLLGRGGPASALVGRDTRPSGPMVGAAVTAGLLSAGISVEVAGVLPTPAVARVARARRLGLGVVISASHNPVEDNGVKVFLGNGMKADPAFEDEVEARLARDPADRPRPGTFASGEGAASAYAADVLREFADLSLEGLRIVVDAANGAAARTAPPILAALGAVVLPLHDSLAGGRINRGCGALHPRVAARAVVRLRADLGVTLDGDGDRALFADETGRVLDGDAVLAILARDLLARRALRGRTVVATVMSNLGLEVSLAEAGLRLHRSPVGDRHVVEAMRRLGAPLGGEQSGHVVVRSGGRHIGDGLVTALCLLRALRAAGGPLSALAACYRAAPQVLLGVPVREKPPLESLPEVQRAIEEAEERLGSDGRLVVRYSGTEPLARVMVEGLDRTATRRAAEAVAAAVRRTVGSGT